MTIGDGIKYAVDAIVCLVILAALIGAFDKS